MRSEYRNALSVFDLDNTLLKINVGFSFGRYLFQRGDLSLGKALLLLICYLCHLSGFISIDRLHQQAFRSFFRGKSASRLKKLAKDFFAGVGEDMINAPILAELLEAKKDNRYTVILSSSPDFLVSVAAQKFAVDDWAGACYLIGKTGVISAISSGMRGVEKAGLLRELICKLNISLKNTAAYTDSFHDIPLLEIVGRPVAVNPDRILRKESERRGWEIMEV